MSFTSKVHNFNFVDFRAFFCLSLLCKIFYFSILASAHVRCNTLADYMAIANQLKEFFHNEGIHSTTIQPEFSACSESLAGSTEELIDACVLECDENCAERTCCGNTTAGESTRDANKKESRLVETETETEQPNGVSIA